MLSSLTAEQARRRRQYREAIRTARDLGVSDAHIAEVVKALGRNPDVDDLETALAQYIPVLNGSVAA